MIKSKTKRKVSFLEEIKVVGYVEGFSDGRNEIIKQFEKFGLLKKNWKKEYNKQIKDDGYMIK